MTEIAHLCTGIFAAHAFEELTNRRMKITG